jgi:hypothetical protein
MHAAAPECDDGFLVNKDGWCYNAPGTGGAPVDFSCKNGCAAGEVCNPWGNCEPCGKNGQRKCAAEPGCEQGTTANAVRSLIQQREICPRLQAKITFLRVSILLSSAFLP